MCSAAPLRVWGGGPTTTVMATPPPLIVKLPLINVATNAANATTQAPPTIPNNTRRLNRGILTQMNVGQLQVILNFFLSQIETLNEDLVEFLIVRDELVIEQDSLLTDIEDITKCISNAEHAC